MITSVFALGWCIMYVTHSNDKNLINNPGWRRTMRIVGFRFCGFFSRGCGFGFFFKVKGRPIFNNGITIVCNHVSIGDIMCLSDYLAAAFVAKEGVRKVPFIGYVADKIGTIFVKRSDDGTNSVTTAAATTATGKASDALVERQQQFEYPHEGAAPLVVFPGENLLFVSV
jgi:1-acyl-sn-glycerol-3-phosphate acyltransferase